MNLQNRSQLNKILSLIENIKEQVEEIKESEKEKFDNLPESFKDGKKRQKFEEVIGHLDDSFYCFTLAIDCIKNAIEL
jgi:hypothetical protein